ncbi:hypothetical protein AB834_04535 [PVC group bacterium (ex Bugula neritina AB1)]|nr:hypothetical protein AB834_04535 [PVC group bacterium (ex Bugula neritina AB1)]
MLKIFLYITLNFYMSISLFSLGVNSEIKKPKALLERFKETVKPKSFPSKNKKNLSRVVFSPILDKENLWRSFFKIMGILLFFFLASTVFFILGQYLPSLYYIPFVQSAGLVIFILFGIIFIQSFIIMMNYCLFKSSKTSKAYGKIRNFFYKILPRVVFSIFIMLAFVAIILCLNGINIAIINILVFFTFFLPTSILYTDFGVYIFLKYKYKGFNEIDELKITDYRYIKSLPKVRVLIAKKIGIDTRDKYNSFGNRQSNSIIYANKSLNYIYVNLKQKWLVKTAYPYVTKKKQKGADFQLSHEKALTDNIFLIVSLLDIFEVIKFSEKEFLDGATSDTAKKQRLKKYLNLYLTKSTNTKLFFHKLYKTSFSPKKGSVLPDETFIARISEKIRHCPATNIKEYKTNLKDLKGVLNSFKEESKKRRNITFDELYQTKTRAILPLSATGKGVAVQRSTEDDKKKKRRKKAKGTTESKWVEKLRLKGIYILNTIAENKQISSYLLALLKENNHQNFLKTIFLLDTLGFLQEGFNEILEVKSTKASTKKDLLIDRLLVFLSYMDKSVRNPKVILDFNTLFRMMIYDYLTFFKEAAKDHKKSFLYQGIKDATDKLLEIYQYRIETSFNTGLLGEIHFSKMEQEECKKRLKLMTKKFLFYMMSKNNKPSKGDKGIQKRDEDCSALWRTAFNNFIEGHLKDKHPAAFSTLTEEAFALLKKSA